MGLLPPSLLSAFPPSDTKPPLSTPCSVWRCITSDPFARSFSHPGHSNHSRYHSLKPPPLPSSSRCMPRLPSPQPIVKGCIPYPWSCGHLCAGPPGQIAPSAYRTPTEATPGLCMLPSHHRHRKILPSMSALGVPPPPVVSCHLGTLSFVTTDIYPLLFRHHQGFPVANHCVQQQKRLNEELHNCTPGELYIFIQSLKVTAD